MSWSHCKLSASIWTFPSIHQKVHNLEMSLWVWTPERPSRQMTKIFLGLKLILRLVCLWLWQNKRTKQINQKYLYYNQQFKFTICRVNNITVDKTSVQFTLIIKISVQASYFSFVGRFTENGFEKQAIPAELWDPLSKEYQKVATGNTLIFLQEISIGNII